MPDAPLAPHPSRPADATDPPRPHGHRLRLRWPALLGVLTAVVIFGDRQPIDLGTFSAMLVLMAVLYVVLGAVRGELGDRRERALQIGALAAAAALAWTAVSVAPDQGRLVLAAGWLAHAGWDVVHHWRGRVVPRGWSEWCGVLDVLGGAAILLLPVGS